VERAILPPSAAYTELKDNVAIINATDMKPLVSIAENVSDLKQVVQDGVSGEAKSEVVTPVIELPVTTGVQEMLTNNHVSAELGGGVLVQNGLTTTQTHTKAATGEEVLQTPVVTTRRQYGLPDNAVIFCNFNQLYKIDPAILKVWCNILKRVPQAVLWLLRFPAVGEANIIQFCVQQGVEAERIVFSPVAPKEEHVRRGQLADVCLDTPLCNGHTTGVDVLWAGTPMVTRPLESLASRVASSQLKCLGLPELIANSFDDYENIAVRLGNEADYLKSIRAKVWMRKTESPLFNVKTYTRNLERLFKRMWENHATNGSPQHLTEDFPPLEEN